MKETKPHQNKRLRNMIFGDVFMDEWMDAGKGMVALREYAKELLKDAGAWGAIVFGVHPKTWGVENKVVPAGKIPRRAFFSAFVSSMEAEQEARRHHAALKMALETGNPVLIQKIKQEVLRSVYVALNQRANVQKQIVHQRLFYLGAARLEAAQKDKKVPELLAKAEQRVWHPAFAAAFMLERPQIPKDVIRERQMLNQIERKCRAAWKQDAKAVADGTLKFETALPESPEYPISWLEANLKTAIHALEKNDEKMGVTWRTTVNPKSGRVVKKAIKKGEKAAPTNQIPKGTSIRRRGASGKGDGSINVWRG